MRKGNLVSIVTLVCTLIPNSVLSSPTIFPTGVTIHDAGRTWPGYTLYVPINLVAVEPVKLIDMEGNLVHTWDLDPIRLDYIKPLPGGRFMGLGPYQDRLVEVDWEGRILWSFEPDRVELHHSFQRLESGNTLILAHRKLWIPSISLFPFNYDYFVEMTPGFEVERTWYSWEHIDDFGFGPEAKAWIHEPKIVYFYPDFSHTNSIQALPPNRHEEDPRFRRGNVLMSQRNTNLIIIIDKDTGELVWRIGPDDTMTIGQHDAHMIEEGLPGAGNILVFDNGGSAGYPTKAREYSRVLEIDPTTKAVVWAYSAASGLRAVHTFFSHTMSGAQRLPNGNTLITEGVHGRLFEVTAGGEIVWECIENNPPKLIYKAYRVDLDWPPSPGR